MATQDLVHSTPTASQCLGNICGTLAFGPHGEDARVVQRWATPARLRSGAGTTDPLEGLSKGEVVLVSIDGGEETFRRIKDSDTMLTASVSIPFEAMGEAAVDAMKRIAIDGETKDAITAEPYLYMNAEIVDQSNVDAFIQK